METVSELELGLLDDCAEKSEALGAYDEVEATDMWREIIAVGDEDKTCELVRDANPITVGVAVVAFSDTDDVIRSVAVIEICADCTWWYKE